MSSPVELPKFEAGKTYVLRGDTLNQIMDAIRQSQIVDVVGGTITRTPEGVIVKIGE